MDIEQLFKPLLPEKDVEIPGRGTVRVRSLTRAEVHSMPKKDPSDAERHFIAAGMVDPTMNTEDVRRWQESASPGEITVVVDAIGKLSGFTPDAEKEAYKSVPG